MDEVQGAVRGTVDPREGGHVLGSAEQPQDVGMSVVHGSGGRVKW